MHASQRRLSRRVPRLLLLALPATFVSLLSPALALSAAPKDEEGWEWGAELRSEGEYNSNVFNLSSTGKDRVRDQDPVNRSNGRLRDMESVDDFIISSHLEIIAETENSLGHFSIAPSTAYHRFIENDEKSYAEVGAKIRQTLPHSSAVELRANYDIDVFRKNYLEDTIGTGEITDAERVYERGIYDEFDIDLSYERRLWRTESKRRKRQYAWASMLTGEVRAQYRMRDFEKHFSNRDLDIYGGDFVLRTAFGEGIDVKLSYGYRRYDAPGHSEVSIIDEPDVGVDLNSDGDDLDNNIRTVTDVDRTRNQHEAAVKIKMDMARNVRVWVGYEYIFRDYDSNNFLDVAHHNREDNQHTAQAGIRWKFAKQWAVKMEGEYSKRTSNKNAFSLDDEDAQKTGGTAKFLIIRRF